MVHCDGGIVPAVGDQHPAWVVANGGFDVEPVLIGGGPRERTVVVSLRAFGG